MSLAFDEFGRPFIIIKEQDAKKRIKGVDALKINIMAARTISNTLKSSMGPKGMDKMMQSPDGEIVVTNDGATIVEKMEVEHPTAKLLVELSKSQDNEIGDGTTGVVVLAGAILEQAQFLLDKGLHPLKISDGFDQACDLACKRLDEIAEEVNITENDNEFLVAAAMTSLGSKVVSNFKRKLAEITKNAILAVADLERKDVNFELIKINGKTGGSLNDTCMINGILLDKDMSHPQMAKEIKDAKICILTCPFEPPKPKTKHNLNITSAEDYKKLQEQEQNYFTDMVKKVKDSGASIALCQWGFDDEANHLLLQNNLPAVRWVGGVDIELVAMATGARIIPRFQEIVPQKLGKAGMIKEVHFGTTDEKMIIIEECSKAKAVTIFVRGGSSMIVAEAQRSIHDALCSVRNLIKCNRVVYGGGSSELACSLYLQEESNKIDSIEQYAVRAYADALEQIPTILAENSGLNPISAVADAKALQIGENNPRIGIDCMIEDCNDMKLSKVYESYLSKRQQLQLATQVVKMILKIDDIIAPDSY